MINRERQTGLDLTWWQGVSSSFGPQPCHSGSRQIHEFSSPRADVVNPTPDATITQMSVYSN